MGSILDVEDDAVVDDNAADDTVDDTVVDTADNTVVDAADDTVDDAVDDTVVDTTDDAVVDFFLVHICDSQCGFLLSKLRFIMLLIFFLLKSM